jgi:hypothetical protein
MDRLYDPNHQDGAGQCDQHGQNGDGIIHCPDTQQRVDEVPCQERADNAYYDIDQQPQP